MRLSHWPRVIAPEQMRNKCEVMADAVLMVAGKVMRATCGFSAVSDCLALPACLFDRLRPAL